MSEFHGARRSARIVTGRPGTLRNAASFVTNKAHPCSRAVAAWIASGVLRLLTARSRAARSRTVVVTGASCTSEEFGGLHGKHPQAEHRLSRSGSTNTSSIVSSLLRQSQNDAGQPDIQPGMVRGRFIWLDPLNTIDNAVCIQIDRAATRQAQRSHESRSSRI